MAQVVPTLYTPDDDEELGSALVSALSEPKGRDVSQDECVRYDNVDPDALDSLLRSDRDDDTVKIEFATHDAIVVVWRDSQLSIEVQDLESDPNYR
jgi:hypothetical protein